MSHLKNKGSFRQPNSAENNIPPSIAGSKDMIGGIGRIAAIAGAKICKL